MIEEGLTMRISTSGQEAELVCGRASSGVIPLTPQSVKNAELVQVPMELGLELRAIVGLYVRIRNDSRRMTSSANRTGVI